MNIYICSTVRHLLFALCRANSRPDATHSLLFFADYQHASLAGWKLSSLPANIRVFELSRDMFRHRLERTVAGRLSYQFSRTLFPAPASVRKPVIETLHYFVPDLAGALQAETSFTLWLFNDRNRMARLFRLLTPEFRVIEDGESNYIRYRVPWWKMPPRLLLGQPLRCRSMGDDPRCKEIWVNYPESLMPELRDKGHAIDFLDCTATAQFIRKIMGDHGLPVVTSRTVILATQPLDGMAEMSVSDKQRVYGTIVDFLESRGYSPILKIHPAEKDADYAFLSGRVVPAPAKVPVEALLMSAGSAPILLSVSSSAGLGFEQFCRRLKLIENNDFATMRRWARHPAELLDSLTVSLAGIQSDVAHLASQVPSEIWRVAL